MEEVNKETWDKKKIFLAVFLLIVLVTGAYYLKKEFLTNPSEQTKLVEGASTVANSIESGPKINIQDAVQQKIDSIKQEVSGLNLMEVASSSPQVQKVLNDIKDLQQYPTNQIKDLCRKICGL
jgi:uncharacterized membrane protein